MKLSDPETALWHGESLLVDGRRAGHVTSGAYGHTLGASVALDYREVVTTVPATRRNHGMNFRRNAAKAVMRSSSQPCRQRWMLVSPYARA